ncbi:hypothetical protein [Streptomyces thioluteus]|uniref:hypothetical protein n=1 Tax=Streptomyces thioluteus TaxID=66431 RepID=UPI0031F0BE88
MAAGLGVGPAAAARRPRPAWWSSPSTAPRAVREIGVAWLTATRTPRRSPPSTLPALAPRANCLLHR